MTEIRLPPAGSAKERAIDGPMGVAMDVAGRTRLDSWALSGDASFHY